MYISLSINWFLYQHDLHSLPTRRSSDLPTPRSVWTPDHRDRACCPTDDPRRGARLGASPTRTRIRRVSDRKSTRLNSSHVAISYAVFCLKKKKKTLYVMF